MKTNPYFQHPFMSDQVINSMAQNVVVIDQDGLIIHTNNQWGEFCSKNDGDIKKCGIGINYFEVCLRSYKNAGITEMIYVLRNMNFILNGRQESFSYEYPCYSPDEKRWFLMYVTPLQQGAGKRTGAVIVHVDITAKKLAEEHMIYQERLSAIGQLVATVAHEIRNPLTTLKGFWQLFNHHPNHTLQTYADVINQEIQEIEDIITRFMILADPIQEQVVEMNTLELLQHALKLMEVDSSKYTVTISYPYHADSLLIRCNENQMIHAFKNIMNNAFLAMPDGGELAIHIETHNNRVELAFTDEGCGIPIELLGKLGEPFYITDKKGSGLGLMLVYQIIHKHNGTVSIESQLNHGTKVKVALPTT